MVNRGKANHTALHFSSANKVVVVAEVVVVVVMVATLVIVVSSSCNQHMTLMWPLVAILCINAGYTFVCDYWAEWIICFRYLNAGSVALGRALQSALSLRDTSYTSNSSCLLSERHILNLCFSSLCFTFSLARVMLIGLGNTSHTCWCVNPPCHRMITPRPWGTTQALLSASCYIPHLIIQQFIKLDFES